MTPIGVLVHGPDATADGVAERLDPDGAGRYVVAAAPSDATLPAMALAGCRFAVGVSAQPWPAPAQSHAAARDTLHAAGTPYYAVETWHRHATWLDVLGTGIEIARTALTDPDPHVLFTAPGPDGDVPPERLTFLRETAADVVERQGLRRSSIAWTGGRRAPSVAAALEALVQALGHRPTVVRCDLDPFDEATGEVDVAARAHRVAVAHAPIEARALTRILADVVTTVVEHEG